MKNRYSIFLALAVFAAAVASLCVGAVFSEVDPEVSLPDLPEADYELQVAPLGAWENVDLFLAPKTSSIDLAAKLISPGNATESKPAKVEFEWSADAGTIEKIPGEDSQASHAKLAFSKDSKLITLQVTARIRFDNALFQPIVIARTFKLLPPISSHGIENGKLRGYDIGYYLDPRAKSKKKKSSYPNTFPERYETPKYFYRVTPEMKSMRISPHLTLGHFVIDFPWGSLGMPQYVAIDLELIEKLEDLISLLEKDGRFPITGLTSIYGFRPPSFNVETMLGQPETTLKVAFSMHQYGRALDFIIDENNDLIMDDLNADGKSDIHDAAVIVHYVNKLDRKYRREKKLTKVGGAGLYEHHDFVGRIQTPYVHVDNRGFEAIGGGLIRWKEPKPYLWPDGSIIEWDKI